MSEEANVQQHPEDYCHRCGGPNISWYTPGGAWDPVMRPVPGEPWKWDEIICPTCFVSLAGGGTWALIPLRDDGERWTSADEREQIKAEAVARVREVLDDERLPFHYKQDALRAATTEAPR